MFLNIYLYKVKTNSLLLFSQDICDLSKNYQPSLDIQTIFQHSLKLFLNIDFFNF